MGGTIGLSEFKSGLSEFKSSLHPPIASPLPRSPAATCPWQRTNAFRSFATRLLLPV